MYAWTSKADEVVVCLTAFKRVWSGTFIGYEGKKDLL